MMRLASCPAVFTVFVAIFGLASVAVCGCGSAARLQSCSIDGGPAGIGDQPSQSQLPSGPCASSAACRLQTRDTCPGSDATGPLIDWRCDCTQAAWACVEVQRSKTACIDPRD